MQKMNYYYLFFLQQCLSDGNLQNELASVPCCKLLLSCRGAIALSEIMPKPIIPRRQFCYKEVICYFKASKNKHIKKCSFGDMAIILGRKL